MADPSKVLASWRKKFLDSLAPETRKLISQANWDLYYGPIGDGAYGDPCDDPDSEFKGYPGFSAATHLISEALDSLPSTLYVDADCDQWQEREPEHERCEACEGEGCNDCNGRGGWEASGDWWRFEREDLKKEIVGQELLAYV